GNRSQSLVAHMHMEATGLIDLCSQLLENAANLTDLFQALRSSKNSGRKFQTKPWAVDRGIPANIPIGMLLDLPRNIPSLMVGKNSSLPEMPETDLLMGKVAAL